MQYRSIKGFSGGGAFGILLLFIGVGFILAAIAQGVIGFAMVPAGTSMDKMADQMMKAMLDPRNVQWTRLSQVLGTFALLFLPAFLYNLVVNGKSWFWLGFSKWFTGRQVVIGFFMIVAANFFAAPLADATKWAVAHFPSLDAMAKKMEDTYNEQVLVLSHLKGWGEYLMALVIMAFFPALFEEMFFRGAVQNLLEKWWKKPLIAIIATSLFFSLIHFSIYLFLSRAVLGFILGMMYYKTRNIWVNVIAHFLNNAIAVTQLFYLSMQNQKIEVDKLDPKAPWWVALLGFAALMVLFILLEKYSAENKARIVAKAQVLEAQADPLHSITRTENL